MSIIESLSGLRGRRQSADIDHPVTADAARRLGALADLVHEAAVREETYGSAATAVRSLARTQAGQVREESGDIYAAGFKAGMERAARHLAELRQQCTGEQAPPEPARHGDGWGGATWGGGS